VPSKIITNALKEKRTVLTEIESKQLMSEAGMPVIESGLAKTKAQAIAMSKKLGLPRSVEDSISRLSFIRATPAGSS